nr:transcriptional regulator [Limosilactobacillus mucosae]
MSEKPKEEFDYSLLMKRMAKYRFNIKSLAAEIGMDRGSLGSKLKNQTRFNQSQITNIAGVLDLKTKEIPAYFFTKNVEKNSQIVRIKKG